MGRPFLEGSFTVQKKKKADIPTTPQLAIVTWLDAFDGPTGWMDPKSYKPNPIRPISIGWVIPDFLDDYITLAGTFLVDTNEENKESKAEYYSNPAHIPLKMVQSITYIDAPMEIVDLMLSDFNTRGFNAD